ncbi:MAG: F0F1 ATP synthase subunit delta, partial [Epsilonproteobacteria bacterium]|nr:F0F1 ATP synthase subunit delta [Campylobacterota bacterium]
MIPVVAKKYVKALLQGCSDDKYKEYYDKLALLNGAFYLEKMKNIILSPNISKDEKYNFLISLVENKDKHFDNFIKILVENDRLMLIPAICDELRYQISLKENSFVGKIISNKPFDDNSIKNIEEKLSSKFNATIKLDSFVTDYPGIK